MIKVRNDLVDNAPTLLEAAQKSASDNLLCQVLQ